MSDLSQKLRKALFLLMDWHGIKEGDVMHHKCVLCMLWRRMDFRKYGVRHSGFWAMPNNESESSTH